MMDGGVENTSQYAGYNRFSVTGKRLWIEVSQNYAELYNDWNCNDPRQYGLWNIEDVKILSPEEIPDTESFEWRAENEIWGTNGLDGNQPTTYVLLKDCSKEHLRKISKLCESRGNKELQRIVNYWLTKKI